MLDSESVWKWFLMDSVQAAVWDEAVPGPTDAASPSWKDEDREGHYISVLGRTSLRDVRFPLLRPIFFLFFVLLI